MPIKPFINTSSATGNIVFNFQRNPVGDLTAFANGYRHAAQALTTRLQRNAYADYDGYPVLYLYRHSLELYLKAVVFRGARLMGLVGEQRPEVSKLWQHHGLARLLPALRAIFRSMDWDLDETIFGTWTELEKFVTEIDGIDPGSYAFRYPVTTRGSAHLPHHFVLNVVNFAETMDALLGYLAGAADLLEHTFHEEAEARYEVQRLLEIAED
jgi:hypothetical protein